MSMGWTMGTLACLAGVKGALAAARATTLAGLWRPKAEAPVARMQKAAVNFIVAAIAKQNAAKWAKIAPHEGQTLDSLDSNFQAFVISFPTFQLSSQLSAQKLNHADVSTMLA
jgi:hypothetical protein